MKIQEFHNMYIPTTTIPNYIPAPAQPCPSCGRCPNCGRGGYDTRPYSIPQPNIGINPYPSNLPNITYTVTA